MPSLQSIALLALASTVSAYAFDDEFSGYDLVARNAGFDNFDDLMEIYERDIDGSYLEGQVLVRSAKGGSKPSSGAGKKPSGGGGKSTAGKILKGAGKGASAFGDVGTGLTGISDVAGLFMGKGGNSQGQGSPPPSKRDLEDLDDDFELFIREASAKRRPSASSIGHTISAAGHGASHGASAFGHVGDGLTGVYNIASLFQGNGGANSGANSQPPPSKRDLEDLLDDAFEIYVRELGLEDSEY